MVPPDPAGVPVAPPPLPPVPLMPPVPSAVMKGPQSVQKLHHDQNDAFVHRGIEHADHVLVQEPHQELRFRPRALREVTPRLLRRRNRLDRHRPVQKRIVRSVHPRLPASAEQCLDLVLSDAVAGAEGSQSIRHRSAPPPAFGPGFRLVERFGEHWRSTLQRALSAAECCFKRAYRHKGARALGMPSHPATRKPKGS
jgi:hypothetical protein